MIGRKTASIWLSQQTIYILKQQRTWYGRTWCCQADSYSCSKNWQESQDSMARTLRDVVETYGLQGYTLFLLVSGPQLIWKRLSLQGKNKKDVLQMAMWEELVGDGNTAYAMDVLPASAPGAGGLREWIVAAYPYGWITDMLDIWEQAACQVAGIDALPAAASRCFAAQTGVLYLADRGQAHAITFSQGQALSYQCITAFPAEAAAWLATQETDTTTAAVWLLDDQVWTAAALAASAQRRGQRWELSYPAVLLAVC